MAVEVQRPALAFHRHLVPAMQILQLKVAGNLDIVYGAGELDARSDRAVNPHIAPENQRAEFTERAPFQLDIEVHPLRPPTASAGHAAPEAVRGAVGAGGLAGKPQIPIGGPARARHRIEVHVIDVENGFRIAELEIDAPLPHFQARQRRHHSGREQRLEIPLPRIPFHQVDDRLIEPQRRHLQLAGPKRFQLQTDINGTGLRKLGDRLDTEGRVIGNFHVTEREARSTEEIEMHRADFDLAPERGFERLADALPVTVRAQKRRRHAGHDERGQTRQKPAPWDASPLHADSIRRR